MPLRAVAAGRVHAPNGAGEQGVGDDAVAALHPRHRGAGADHDADVLVPDHEGERGERRRGRRDVQADEVEIASAHATQARGDAHPAFAGERRRLQIAKLGAAQRAGQRAR
jgi:hypothetical protein